MNDLPIRRNTILLAATVVVNSATLQLVAAVSALTFAAVTGYANLLGLGPALFIISSAVAAFPAGRMMDKRGRVPVLALGFAVGGAGAFITAAGTWLSSPWIAIPGVVLTGAAGATGSLIRAAAGDMYPPARRARGIANVMFGAVAGAILGPLVFSPIFKDRALSPGSLALSWSIGGVMMMIALATVLTIRPDPKRIAEILEGGTVHGALKTSAPLRELIQRPGAIPAMIVGVISYAVMVAVMNLTGYVVVQHYHHPQHVIFPIIGAHVLGMYLLMPVVGAIVDKIGRPIALICGLTILAASTAGLVWFEAVVPIAVLLFGLGLGWNVSFVAATTQLANLASPSERGKLLGFNDLLAGLTGAVFVLLGGYVLNGYGLTALAFSVAAISLAPVVMISREIIAANPAAAGQQ